MKRRALVVLWGVCVARIAAADRVAVQVVDSAGDGSYIEPGAAAGLAAGMKVHFGGQNVAIVDCTEKTCTIRAVLPIGTAGTADAQLADAGHTEKLPPPRQLSAFKDQWPAAVRPATHQKVDAVPLGETALRGTNHLAVYGNLFGNLDKDGSGGQAEARVVASFDRVVDAPLGADVDAALRLFGTGWDSGSNKPLFVRAAMLRWGDPADPSIAIGRLRYAATSVGMLDGGRVAYHAGHLELAAFGGIVPDAVNGVPSTSASRFGTEITYDVPSDWHPHVALAAHGSTWNGAIDERRLSLNASANHGSSWLTAWSELQLFDANNPWGAPTVDVTGAGATYEWRHRGNHLGFDVTFLRPERSLRLAAALPASWLCAQKTLPGMMTEPCLGGDYWAAATVSGGMVGDDYSVEAVGSLGTTQSLDTQNDLSAYVRGELGARAHRAVLAVSGGHESFAAWEAADVGFASSVSRFDVSLTYRPERLDYAAATSAYVLHSLVTDLHWSVAAAFDVAIEAMGTTGADRDVLELLTTLAWRPLP
jgi:hypothetical protein